MALATPFSENEAIYFLHIPKTAGTSFTTCLNEQYSSEDICPVHLWHDLLKISPNQRAKYRVFRGHFYSYLNRVVDQPLQVITFLRDPIERSLSHYWHVRRDPGHYFHQLSHEQGSILAFLNDSRTSPLITNFQTRTLALECDPVAIASTLSQEELDALVLEQKLETVIPQGITDDELLERAKAKLDQCLFVGLTEQFTESISSLAQILQWKKPPEAYFLNRAPERTRKDELDSATLKVLNEHNYLDHELYAHAHLLFERLSSTQNSPLQ